MKVCTRGCAATRTASPQRRMSLSLARASPQIDAVPHRARDRLHRGEIAVARRRETPLR